MKTTIKQPSKLQQAQLIIDSAFLSLGAMELTDANSNTTEEIFKLTSVMLQLSQASQLLSEARAERNSGAVPTP